MEELLDSKGTRARTYCTCLFLWTSQVKESDVNEVNEMNYWDDSSEDEPEPNELVLSLVYLILCGIPLIVILVLAVIELVG